MICGYPRGAPLRKSTQNRTGTIPCGCPQFAQKPKTTYCLHRDLRVPTRSTPTKINTKPYGQSLVVALNSRKNHNQRIVHIMICGYPQGASLQKSTQNRTGNPLWLPSIRTKLETTYCSHHDLRVPTRGIPTKINTNRTGNPLWLPCRLVIKDRHKALPLLLL